MRYPKCTAHSWPTSPFLPSSPLIRIWLTGRIGVCTTGAARTTLCRGRIFRKSSHPLLSWSSPFLCIFELVTPVQKVNGSIISNIGPGLVALIGIGVGELQPSQLRSRLQEKTKLFLLNQSLPSLTRWYSCRDQPTSFKDSQSKNLER